MRCPGAGWRGSANHGWATEHDSIAEAVARRLSAERARAAACQAAEGLRRYGGDPSEVAHHLAGSGDQSAAASAYAEAARLALDRFANEEATRLIDQALALRPDEPSGARSWRCGRRSGRAPASSRCPRRPAGGAAETAVGVARARLLARLAMLTLGARTGCAPPSWSTSPWQRRQRTAGTQRARWRSAPSSTSK